MIIFEEEFNTIKENMDHPFVKEIISRPYKNIKVEIIADSLSKEGERLITLQMEYPRYIHGELLTHKRFSRNASSSRARPINKEIERVKENTAVPIFWGKNQSGMSAYEELKSNEGCADIQDTLLNLWLGLRDHTIKTIEYMNAISNANANGTVHKQTLNRLIEPFQLMETVFTGNYTSFLDFFLVRLHHQAQPEMIKLAHEIYKTIERSYPTETLYHLPYVEKNLFNLYNIDTLMKISSARCARVSYRLFDGSQDIEKDLELADKLLVSKPPHASPAEHCAIAKEGKHANFYGWINYRTMLGI